MTASRRHGVEEARDGGLAGVVVSARGDVRRQRHELRALLGRRRGGGALPLRGGRHRDAGADGRRRRVRLALLPARRAARHPLRLSRARAVGPGEGAALQPEQAAARPLREVDVGRLRLGPGGLRLRLRVARQPQRRGLGSARDARRRGEPVLRLDGRREAGHRLPGHDRVRGAREGHDEAAPGRAAGRARHVRRARASGRARAPAEARDHRDRADAGAPVRAGQPPHRAGPAQLLGLQHHRLLRPAQRVRRRRAARRAGAGVQGDGEAVPRRGHRGDPRRRLQPHRGGQPPRPDALDARHRQRRLLQAAGRRPAAATPTTPARATPSTCGSRTPCSC